MAPEALMVEKKTPKETFKLKYYLPLRKMNSDRIKEAVSNPDIKSFSLELAINSNSKNIAKYLKIFKEEYSLEGKITEQKPWPKNKNYILYTVSLTKLKAPEKKQAQNSKTREEFASKKPLKSEPMGSEPKTQSLLHSIYNSFFSLLKRINAYFSKVIKSIAKFFSKKQAPEVQQPKKEDLKQIVPKKEKPKRTEKYIFEYSANPSYQNERYTDAKAEDRKNTYLIVGLDEGNRADALHVLQFDTLSNKIILLPIPRDTKVPIAGHGTAKINAAYAYGGITLQIKTVEAYLGIKINGYSVANFDTFKTFYEQLSSNIQNIKEKRYAALFFENLKKKTELENKLRTPEAEALLAKERNRTRPGGANARALEQSKFIEHVLDQWFDAYTKHKLASDHLILPLSLKILETNIDKKTVLALTQNYAPSYSEKKPIERYYPPGSDGIEKIKRADGSDVGVWYRSSFRRPVVESKPYFDYIPLYSKLQTLLASSFNYSSYAEKTKTETAFLYFLDENKFPKCNYSVRPDGIKRQNLPALLEFLKPFNVECSFSEDGYAEFKRKAPIIAQAR
ncbi:MAG: LCP family protein [Candidatus Micrarchaeota archaeon]